MKNIFNPFISGLLSSLLGTGFYHTMSGYIQGSKSLLASSRHKSSDLQNFQFECAWRLGQWDSLGDDDSADLTVGSSFSRNRFLALDNLLGENGNEHEFVRHLGLASRDVGVELSRLKSCESACSIVAGPLVRLRAVRELQVISELMPRIGKGHELDSDLSRRVSENLEQVFFQIFFVNFA